MELVKWEEENTAEYPKVNFRKGSMFEFKTLIPICRNGVFYDLIYRDKFYPDDMRRIKNIFENIVHVKLLFFIPEGVLEPSANQSLRKEIILTREQINIVENDPTLLGSKYFIKNEKK